MDFREEIEIGSAKIRDREDDVLGRKILGRRIVCLSRIHKILKLSATTSFYQLQK